jgi:outer membrane immunogenic protein
MKTIFVAGVFAAAFYGAPAMAADMPLKAPPVAQVADPLWTGWYLGLNAGGSWGTSQTSTSTTAVAGPGLTLSALSIGIINGIGAPTNIDTSSFTGGAQGGYNYQIGQWLVGIEADFEYFRNAGSNTTSSATGAFVLNSSVSTDWLFTARPRLGFISNNWLFYGTGGLAVTRLSAAWNMGGTALISESASASATRAGWVVGGGVETKLPGKWLLGVEYLYVNFDSISATGFSNASGAPVANPINHSADLNANIVRARLSKLF